MRIRVYVSAARLDIGLIGCATGDFAGLSVGGVNIVSRRLAGLQVGLLNIVLHNGFLPVLPIVNGYF